MAEENQSTATEYLATFGEFLRHLRDRIHLSLRDLALAVGYSEGHLSRIERNERRPPDIPMLTAHFITALQLQHEPVLVARLMELAAAARGEPLSGTQIAWTHAKHVETTTTVRMPTDPTERDSASGDQPRTDREPQLRALRHDHAGFIVNRLEAFIGREAELAELRQCIAEKLTSGGYVTITGQAGQGKSSIIARLVADELRAQAGDTALQSVADMISAVGDAGPVFHFIPLSPGPDHQVGLLRNLIARLCLKHHLPAFYATSESRPALRDYFVVVLREVAARGGQEVMYIDGLDQLEEDASGRCDLSFLPEAPPVGIVFVLGTRPNDTLKPLTLRKPHHEYWLPPLSRTDFDHVLQHRGVRLDPTLANRFYAAMQENALYLDLVARELAQAHALDPEQIITRVAANPDHLFSISIERLERNEHQWESVLRPILGLLLTARAPLSPRALRALVGVDDQRTIQGLVRLGGLIQRDGEGRYALFHLKLRNFLHQDERQPDQPYVFAADEVATVELRLARWAEGGSGGLETIWEESPGDALEQERRIYARQHYIAHLAAARDYDHLWEVVDAGGYGQAKRRHDPSTHSYVLDLDIARQALRSATTGDTEARARALPRLWRYSLLRCSLSSQVDGYPEELFLALVALGYAQEATHLAELLSDPGRKTNTLCAIGRAMLTRHDRQAVAVLQRASIAAAAIANDQERVQALTALAQVFAQAEHTPEATIAFTTAQQVAEAIANDHERAHALITLAKVLAQAGYSVEAIAAVTAARDVANSLPDDAVRSHILCELAPVVAQTGDRNTAYQIAEAITNSHERTQALVSLAEALAQTGYPGEAIAAIASAREVADSIVSDRQRAPVLVSLAHELPAIAQALAQTGYPGEAIAAVTTACEIADAIVSDRERTQAILSHAQTRANAGDWDAAYQLAASIPDDYVRAQALTTLAQARHKTGNWDAVHQLAASIPTGYVRAQALTTLAQVLTQAGRIREATETFAAARQAAKVISAPRRHIEALMTLAQVLAQAGHTTEAIETFTAAHQAAEAIPTDWVRAEMFAALAQALAEAGHTAEAKRALTAARRTTSTVANDQAYAQALATLAQALAEAGHTAEAKRALTAARRVANAILDTRMRADLLRALTQVGAELAATGTVSAALKPADVLATGGSRAWMLHTLAQALTQANRWEVTHQAAAVIRDPGTRAWVFVDLAFALAHAGYISEAAATCTAAYQAANAMTDPRSRATALRNVAHAITQSGLQQRTITLLCESWYQAATRDDLLHLFAIDSVLFRTYLGIGSQFLESFAWVETQLGTDGAFTSVVLRPVTAEASHPNTENQGMTGDDQQQSGDERTPAKPPDVAGLTVGELITLAEAAEYSGFHTKTLHNYIKRKRLKAVKKGGRWFTTHGAVDQALASRNPDHA